MKCQNRGYACHDVNLFILHVLNLKGAGDIGNRLEKAEIILKITQNQFLQN